jgi:hypothetical protein
VGAVGLAEKLAAARIEAVADVRIEVGGKLKEKLASGATDLQAVGKRQGVSGVGDGLACTVVEMEEDTRAPFFIEADVEDDLARRGVYEGD